MANLHCTITALRFPGCDANHSSSLPARLFRLLGAFLDRTPQRFFIP